MKSFSRKISSAAMALVIATMSMSVAGCSLSKDKEAVNETVTEYLDAVIAGKFSTAAKCVEEEEDAVSSLEIDSFKAQIIDSVMKNASYEIEDTSVDPRNGEGEVEITFSYADPEDVFEDDMDAETFFEALEDCEDLAEKAFTVELTEDDDEWFITTDFTEEFADFLMSLGEGIEFKGLNEASAIALVQQYYDDLASGNISGAISIYEYEGYTQDEMLEELAMAGITDDSTEFAEYMEAMMSRSELTFEATEVEDDKITVVATLNGPDVEELSSYIYTEEVLVPLYADLFYQLLYEGGEEEMDLSSSMALIYSTMAEHIDEVEATSSSDTIFYVMEDEDGELYLTSENVSESFTGGEDIESAFDISDDDMQQYISQAFDLLLEQGRISQEDHDMYATLFAS